MDIFFSFFNMCEDDTSRFKYSGFRYLIFIDSLDFVTMSYKYSTHLNKFKF